jgi:ABC-type branched-subunit amino acid transport system permease subunit
MSASIFIYFGTIIGIYALLSLSLNFQYGFAGLINFGHVGFFAVGAYASAILSSAGYPIALGFVAAFVLAGLVGLLIGLPTQKLSVHYWAIITIAIAEVIRLIALNEEWLTRGSFGIVDIPQPLKAEIPPDLYPIFYLCLVWAFVLAAYAFFALLVRSPFGRILRLIREEEDLALSFGKDVFTYRVKAMAIGAAVAGVSGALYAHYITYISPLDFLPLITFVVWVMVIVGGRANQLGVLLGTAVIVLFFNSTRYLKDYVPLDSQTIASLRMVVIGALIMLTIVYRPNGLIPERKGKVE